MTGPNGTPLLPSGGVERGVMTAPDDARCVDARSAAPPADALDDDAIDPERLAIPIAAVGVPIALFSALDGGAAAATVGVLFVALLTAGPLLVFEVGRRVAGQDDGD